MNIKKSNAKHIHTHARIEFYVNDTIVYSATYHYKGERQKLIDAFRMRYPKNKIHTRSFKIIPRWQDYNQTD